MGIAQYLKHTGSKIVFIIINFGRYLQNFLKIRSSIALNTWLRSIIERSGF